MSWFPWPDAIKKRAVRYILHHYLGAYLQDRISVEQLSIDLYDGTASITDLSLDADEINDKLPKTGNVFKISTGVIGKIIITVPWSNLLKESCKLELSDIVINVKAEEFDLKKFKSEQRAFLQSMVKKHAWAMAESMCKSMAANLLNNEGLGKRCAEDALKEGSTEGSAADKNKGESDFNFGLEGLDFVASTIESILSRTTLTVKNVTVNLELFSPNHILSLKIPRIRFFDEQLLSMPTENNDDQKDNERYKIYQSLI